MNDVLWLLKHSQVGMVNYQNIIIALLQLIVALDVHERVQVDLIVRSIKPDGSYVWILHIKRLFFETKHDLFSYKQKSL